MSVLQPTAAFDWDLVTWGAPDALIATECSYCAEPLHDEKVPLILISKDGWTARFCEACQRTYWGFQCLDDPQ